MTNKFLLNLLGFNPDLTSRQSRVDSLSLVSRQSDLLTYLGRIAAILVLVLTLGVGNAWGADATFSWTAGGTMGTNATGKQGNITLTGAANSASNAPAVTSNTLRLYAHRSSGNGASATFTADDGYQITAITVTSSNGGTILKYSVDGGSYSTFSWSSGSSTISNLTASAITLKNCQNSGKSNTTIQVASVVVTYESTGGGSTPSLTADPTSLGWGTVLQGSSQSTKTFDISGANLTSNLSVAVTGGYSVSCGSSITVTSGTPSVTTITVTPPSTATTGSKNGKVTFSGGGLASNVEVDLTMTVNAAYTVNWYVGGTQVKTELVASGATATLPSTPDDDALGGACSSLKFVGWSETNIGSTPTTAPADLFNAAPTISATKNYYAVFAESSGGGVTEVFADDMNISGTSAVTSRDGWSSFSTAYGGDGSIRLSSSSYMGSMQTNALTSLSGTATITFKAKRWSDTEYEVRLQATKGTFSPATFSTTSSFVEYTSTLTGGDNTTQIIFDGGEYGDRVYIKDIVITCGSVTYSNYVTSCCDALGQINGSFC